MPTRSVSLTAALILAALLAALCAVPPSSRAADQEAIRIGGTGSARGALRLVAQAYQKLHPELAVKLVPNLGSSGGIAALTQGALDLAVCARLLKPEEQKAGLKLTEYARTPFVFAVHARVPKHDLTSSEIASLYRQDLQRWSDGSRVRLILRPEQDSDTALVQTISPAVAQAVRRAHGRPGMVVAVTDQESLDAIARMPGALGTATLTEILTEHRPVRELSYNGVPPTLKNLAAGSYPLYKVYYVATGAKSSPQAQQFAAFLRSARAREILKAAGNLTPGDGREP